MGTGLILLTNGDLSFEGKDGFYSVEQRLIEEADRY